MSVVSSGDSRLLFTRCWLAARFSGSLQRIRAGEGRTLVSFAGAIFDVDGVLVDSPHERAWRETLQLLMENDWRDIQPETTYAPERFTPAVYQEIVAGKPRMSGAR